MVQKRGTLSAMFVQRGMPSVLKHVGCQHAVAAACRTFPNLPEAWEYNFVGFCRRNCFAISLHRTGNLSDKSLRMISVTVENHLLYKKTLLCRRVWTELSAKLCFPISFLPLFCQCS